MKILFIARKFPPSVGGMERFAFDLSNALLKKTDMKRITWGGSNKLLPLVLPVFFVRAFFYLLFHPSTAIIHIQDAVQAPMGWLLSKIFRKPYVVIAHGLDITYTKGFYQTLILPFVRRASAVISISTATNDEALKRGVDKTKASVITIGVHDDYGKVSPNRAELSNSLGFDLSNKVLLLTTGRLVKRKGVAWFIENVLPKLVSNNKDILYLVVGDGSQREVIEQTIAKMDMGEYVKLLGRVSDKERSLLYQSSDVFVMPNIVVPGDMEGFGIVVHEAATAELPVVASNLEGIKDALVDDKNGILVNTRDVEGFLAKLEELIKSKEYRKSFGKKARRFTLDEYSWDKIASKYVSVYKSVLK